MPSFEGNPAARNFSQETRDSVLSYGGKISPGLESVPGRDTRTDRRTDRQADS